MIVSDGKKIVYPEGDVGRKWDGCLLRWFCTTFSARCLFGVFMLFLCGVDVL